MKIAIIGCGVTGLASIRKALEYNLECVAFEQSDDIGGLWKYDNQTKTDGSNNAVLGCYESLRAHLPNFLMKYSHFKHSSTNDANFPRHEEIFEYLKDFAEEYNLKSYIKFNHRVIKVTRIENKWGLTVENLLEHSIKQYEFDGIMICSGHYSEPRFPSVEGINSFRGHQIHSSRYRCNLPYINKRLLVIGGRKSGLEISQECMSVAKEVILSQGKPCYVADLDRKICLKPRTIAIRGQLIYFEDGSSIEVDAIIYCTGNNKIQYQLYPLVCFQPAFSCLRFGYKYYFPFLDPSCGIEIDNHYIVKPLFKQFVNIRYPTMCFIGLLKYTPLFWLADFQAETYVKYMTRRLQLPTAGEMFASLAEENRKKVEKNCPKKFYYLHTGSSVLEYFEDLRKLAHLKSLPPVYFRINNYLAELFCDRFVSVKKLKFNIVDDQTFTVSQLEE